MVNTSVTITNNGSYVLGLAVSDGAASVTDTVTETLQLTTSSTNASEFIADSDTIALWHLNGDGTDVSGNGYTLVFTNGPSFMSGGTATAWMGSPSGFALRVTYPQMAMGIVPHTALLNNANRKPFTIEERVFLNAWGPNNNGYTYCGFSQNADTACQMLQQKWGLPIIQANSGDTVASTNQVVSSLTTGVWHHVMITFDGTNKYQAFVDGVLLGMNTNHAPNWGRTPDITNQFGNFDGYLDEIRISRVVRTYPGTPPPVSVQGVAQGNGLVTPALTNVPWGGAAVFTAAPDAFYHLGEISTNTSIIGGPWPTGQVVYAWSNITAVSTAKFVFIEQCTPRGTPEVWLNSFGCNQPFAVAETARAANGYTYGESYIAGLNPTNPSSVFKIMAVTNQGSGWQVYFQSLTDRTYSLMFATNSPGATWSNVAGQSDIWGSNTLMSLHDTNAWPVRFYRLDVKKP
jgi:Concanavalin A-like lectin/glucanases superfamily